MMAFLSGLINFGTAQSGDKYTRRLTRVLIIDRLHVRSEIAYSALLSVKLSVMGHKVDLCKALFNKAH